MSKLMRVLGLISLLVASGCASTRLTLNLDLYSEDPLYVAPLTPIKVAGIYNGLDLVGKEGKTLADDRKRLASQLFAAYRSTVALTTKIIAPELTPDEINTAIDRNLARTSKHLDDYTGEIDDKLVEIQTLSEQAKNIIENYFGMLKADEGIATHGSKAVIARVEIMGAVRSASNALIELGGPLQTDFEKGFLAWFPDITSSIDSANLKSLLDNSTAEPVEFTQLRSTFRDLGETIAELEERGLQVPATLDENLHELSNVQAADPGALKQSVDAIAAAATALPLSVGLGDRGTVAISELTRSTGLLYSQIDRLQDPADPIWRVVSAPENESKWNKQFTETHFFAQGNSEVVVVRDTPISFRVQRGNNNPTALIKSQLRISRAIGDTAISLAASAAGLPAFNPSNPAPNTNGANTESLVSAESLASAKATVERKSVLRKQVVRNLALNLSNLRRAFEAANGDAQRTGILLNQFNDILDSHAPIFGPEAQGQ
jgi:hypothetical protein